MRAALTDQGATFTHGAADCAERISIRALRANPPPSRLPFNLI